MEYRRYMAQPPAGPIGIQRGAATPPPGLGQRPASATGGTPSRVLREIREGPSSASAALAEAPAEASAAVPIAAGAQIAAGAPLQWAGLNGQPAQPFSWPPQFAQFPQLAQYAQAQHQLQPPPLHSPPRPVSPFSPQPGPSGPESQGGAWTAQRLVNLHQNTTNMVTAAVAVAHIVEREQMKQRLATEILTLLEAYSNGGGAAPLPPQLTQEVNAKMTQLRDALGSRYPEVLQKAIELADQQSEVAGAQQSHPQLQSQPPPQQPQLSKDNPEAKKSPYDVLLQAFVPPPPDVEQLQKRVAELEARADALRAEKEEGKRLAEEAALLAQKREHELEGRLAQVQKELETGRQREDVLIAKLQGAADEIDSLRGRLRAGGSPARGYGYDRDYGYGPSGPAGPAGSAGQAGPSGLAAAAAYSPAQQRELRDRNRSAGMATNFTVGWSDERGAKNGSEYPCPARGAPAGRLEGGSGGGDFRGDFRGDLRGGPAQEHPGTSSQEPPRAPPQDRPRDPIDYPAQEPMDAFTAAAKRVSRAYEASEHILTEEEFGRAVAREMALAEQEGKVARSGQRWEEAGFDRIERADLVERVETLAEGGRYGVHHAEQYDGRYGALYGDRFSEQRGGYGVSTGASAGASAGQWRGRPGVQSSPVGTSSFISAEPPGSSGYAGSAGPAGTANAPQRDMPPPHGPTTNSPAQRGARQRTQISGIISGAEEPTEGQRRYKDLQDKHLAICREKEQCQMELDGLEQKGTLPFKDKLRKTALEQRLEGLRAAASEALREIRELERQG